MNKEKGLDIDKIRAKVNSMVGEQLYRKKEESSLM